MGKASQRRKDKRFTPTTEGRDQPRSIAQRRKAGHRPKATDLPEIVEVSDLGAVLTELAFIQAGASARVYAMGACHIIVSNEPQGLHLSISHPKRYPTWDEIVKARKELLPEEHLAVMFLPGEGEWLSAHDNCFHLQEIIPDTEHESGDLNTNEQGKGILTLASIGFGGAVSPSTLARVYAAGGGGKFAKR